MNCYLKQRGSDLMHYYLTQYGCMGLIKGKYILFATAVEYYEAVREEGT